MKQTLHILALALGALLAPGQRATANAEAPASAADLAALTERLALLEADNARAARAQLRAQSLVPLEVTQIASAGTHGKGLQFTRRVFSSTTLAVWTRQLAGLVGSGLPLERALTALSDEAEDPKQRELVAHLRSEVNAGSSFARALGSAEREFDEVYRGVVAAGEQSGALGQVLERLADDLEERQALKAKLIGATLYPAIVSMIAVVIVIFLVTYVVPQVASVFTSSKRALPGLTVAMLAMAVVAVTAFGLGYGSLGAWRAAAFVAMFFGNGAIVGFYSAFALGFPAFARGTGTGFVLGVGRLGAAGSPIIAGYLFKLFGNDQLLLVSFCMGLGSLAALVLFLLLPMRDGDAEVADGLVASKAAV